MKALEFSKFLFLWHSDTLGQHSALFKDCAVSNWSLLQSTVLHCRLLTNRGPDRSGSCLILIRQQPDRSGCRLILIWHASDRSGSCLILIRQQPDRSGCCLILIWHVPDQSGIAWSGWEVVPDLPEQDFWSCSKNQAIRQTSLIC